ncbi:MAG: adenylate/guanylate cyclase domain-containing protein [Candidatus Limnocylindrales bacterium]
MTCTNCGADTEPDQKFCGECGARLATACSSCGAANPPGRKFCGECGLSLAAVVAGAGTGGSVSRSPASSERRLVSVLFADLVGFTPFAEERDPEDVRETLSRYFDIAADVIARYGGTVEKFIGDAVMAVWGAPAAHEDDAERAVRAALELVDAVRGLGPGIQARAGVLTGEAAVTIGATNQGLVAGDLVNTASRLQSAAPPGTVLVGEVTERAASKAIVFEAAGEQLLKGKAAPVSAWRAVRVVAEVGGRNRTDGLEPPFVGRADELRLLKDALSAAGRDRRTRLVSITGPGGIGKSRLAWEFEKYADGLVEPVYWHRGRSPAYGDGITFWALGEMVRRRAGLAETDDEETTRARVAATVGEFVPLAEDRRWVEPALLTLLGLEAAPVGGRDVLFAAWRIFFERVAARGTSVLLFEDLQWADSGLLDFIEHVLEWSKGVPLVVVTLARPELFERRPGWGADRRNATAMALEALPDPAMRELLGGLVPGLPEAAIQVILARADGVPLYAVETVRALVSDGRLRLSGDTYEPIGDLGTLAIPETLRSLIGSRLDALEAADRALMQDASVLGQAFTLDGLEAVTGRTADGLTERLRGLVRREFLELEADPRSPERGQYRFVQSLIREVAYGTLSKRDRRERHLAVARYFEALGEEELAGALATHLLAAHEASALGPEAEAVAIQARLALRGAAERAASLGAHDQAVTYLEQALAITQEPAERARLEGRASASASLAADHERAERLARTAVEDYRQAGEQAAAAASVADLGGVLLNAGDIRAALPILENALQELSDDAPPDVRARLLANLARARYRDVDLVRSLEVVDQALALAERLDLTDVFADGLNNKAAALNYLGRRREATALMEAAIKIAADAGLVAIELRARSNLASIVWSHEPQRALEMQLANLELAQRVGNRFMAIWVAGPATAGAWQAGADWDRALAISEEILSIARTPGDTAGILAARCLILDSRGESTDEAFAVIEAAGATGADAGDTAQAHAVRARRALLRGEFSAAYAEWVEAAEFSPMEGIYLDAALRPLLWSGDTDGARAVAMRLAARPEANAAVNAANLLAAQAGIGALEGRSDDAGAMFREAWRQYRDLGLEFVFAASVLDAITLLGPATPELRDAAEEARAIFGRLRAIPYLTWLDTAMARQAGAPSLA